MKHGSLIAVTGANGFIGAKFIRDALEHGYRVRAFSRRVDQSMSSKVEHYPLHLGIDCEIDPDLFRGCDAMVHLAAHIPADHSDMEEASRCWDVNALGTLRLLDAMNRGGVHRIIQTVSANAYSPTIELPDENAPMFPAGREFYLTSKIVQEIYVRSYCARENISEATLRLSSVYDASQASGTLNQMTRKMLNGSTLELVNGGEFGADFVRLEDVSSAIFLILSKGIEGPLNVGSGERTTIAAISKMIRSMIGAVPESLRDVRDESVTDLGFAALNISRMRRFGYDPSLLSSGLVELVGKMRDEKTEPEQN